MTSYRLSASRAMQTTFVQRFGGISALRDPLGSRTQQGFGKMARVTDLRERVRVRAQRSGVAPREVTPRDRGMFTCGPGAIF